MPCQQRAKVTHCSSHVRATVIQASLSYATSKKATLVVWLHSVVSHSTRDAYKLRSRRRGRHVSQFVAKSQNDSRKQIEDRLRVACAEIPREDFDSLGKNEDDVILDFVYGDVRCVLLRTHQPNNQHLSPREQEIVRLVAAGHPNKVIAAVLDISYWTVGTHLRRVFAKMGVTSRAAMVGRMRNAQIGQNQDKDASS